MSTLPETTFYSILLIAMFIASPVTLITLLYIPAPYGRHARQGWGPQLNTKLGWILMESAAVFGFGIPYFLGPHAWNPVSLVFFCLWQLHYLDRAFIYPMRLRNSYNMALLPLLCGVLFNVVNGYLNAWNLTALGPIYELSWMKQPTFLAGLILFVVGFCLNRWADHVLLNLRSDTKPGYTIPTKGLFEIISCPNYLGEILQWSGWAVATWSLPGLAFALFTVSNLLPRALTHHAWYQGHFPDYPPKRKAIIPFIL